MQTTTHFSKIILIFTLLSLGACGGSSTGGKPQSQPAAQPQQQQTAPEKDREAPATSAPAPATEEKSTAPTVESLMPQVAPLDTYGGELLKSYLADAKSAEDTLVLLLKDDDSVRSTLAEMSMSIQQLKAEGRYGAAEQEKIHSLEASLQQFLNNEKVRRDNISRYIDYTAAVGVGVMGGVFADRILANFSRNLPKVIPSSVREKLSRFSFRKKADVTAKGTSSGVALRLSSEILTGEEIVKKSMTEAIGSKALVEGGYSTKLLSGVEVTNAKKLIFEQTPFKDFDIAYKEGAEYFVARATPQGGNPEFYRISGDQALLAAKEGKFVTVTPAATTNFLVNKIRDFGRRTVAFVTSNGNKIVTAVSNPRAAKWAKGTAFGAVTGGLTLLVLRDIDANWVSLPDYIQNLAEQGVDVENFLQTELRQSQADSNTLK